MAAGKLPAPGSKIKVNGKWQWIGPCVAVCKHKDCNETRSMANAICPHCSKPIGYETRFYDERSNISIAPEHRALVHAGCVE